MAELKKGIYRHYKGAEYKIISEAVDSENKDKLVVYQDIKDEAKVWVRPKKMFLELVETSTGKQERFAFVGPEATEENEATKENETATVNEVKTEEADSWEQKYLRALADYQNLLKQTARDKQDFVRYALSDFLHDILPVYDHLKLSLAGLNEEESKNPWAIGVSHVLKQFKEVLVAQGVEEIKTVGEHFSHDNMEAISGEGDIVVQEISPGYKLHGRVIRPAKVIVGK